jgi:hypothetical protein
MVCFPGAENAPISHGEFGYEAFRERSGDRSSRWLVDVPIEAVPQMIRGGFKLYEP